MNFLYPQFLWALLAIAIPIIIHLFNFRKFKRVQFSDLQLLKEVELETSKKSNIKHLLILLARIGAIVSLVLAFAQPYFPGKNSVETQGEKFVSVYLDNSFSMNNIAQEFSLLDQGKQQAENIALLYKQSDKFQLITNDFDTRHQRFVTQQEFIALVQEVEPSSSTKLVSQIEQKQLDLLNRTAQQNKLSYFISDFQKTTSDIENMKMDSSIVTNFVFLQPELTGNVYIDSVWFDSPIRVLKRKEKLYVRLKNQTEEDIQVKIELMLNGKVSGILNQDVASNSEANAVLNYTMSQPGVVNAKVKISEYPNPVSTFDDEFYFSYVLNKSSEVLVINQHSKNLDNKSGYVNQLFRSDDYFNVTNSSVNSIDYSGFNQFNLVIINELNEMSSGLVSELRKYVSSGGSVVLFPGTKLDLNSMNEFMLSVEAGRFTKKDTTNTKVNYLNFQHPIFADVFEKIPKNIDLPVVSNSYGLSTSSRSRIEKLMKLQTGNDFLSKFNYKKGNVYVFTVPLDNSFSNLTNHSIFVTSLLRIGESSGNRQIVNQSISSNFVIMKDENYDLSAIHWQNKELEIDVVPESERNRGEIKFFIPSEVKEAGNYLLKNDNSVVSSFGLNYNRLESNFSTYNTDELEDFLGNNGQVIDVTNVDATSSESKEVFKKEFKWWKLFVLLALCFVLIEILLIKFLK